MTLREARKKFPGLPVISQGGQLEEFTENDFGFAIFPRAIIAVDLIDQTCSVASESIVCDGVKFGDYNIFGDGIISGVGCRFGTGNWFGDNNRFGAGNNFGDKNYFGTGNKFSDGCRFGASNFFSGYNLFGYWTYIKKEEKK